jgi:hypothetical protein
MEQSSQRFVPRRLYWIEVTAGVCKEWKLVDRRGALFGV